MGCFDFARIVDCLTLACLPCIFEEITLSGAESWLGVVSFDVVIPIIALHSHSHNKQISKCPCLNTFYVANCLYDFFDIGIAIFHWRKRASATGTKRRDILRSPQQFWTSDYARFEVESNSTTQHSQLRTDNASSPSNFTFVLSCFFNVKLEIKLTRTRETLKLRYNRHLSFSQETAFKTVIGTSKLFSIYSCL